MIVAARFVQEKGLSSSTNQRNQTGQGSDRRVDAKRQVIPVTKNTPTIPKRMPSFLITPRLGEHTPSREWCSASPADTLRREHVVPGDCPATAERDTCAPHLLICETLLSRFSFMNAQLVTIRVHDNCSPAVGHIKGLNSERHLMTPEMVNRSVEVIYFQHEVRTVA